MMQPGSIAERLEAEEAAHGRGARTGLTLLVFWILERGRIASDVIAIDIGRGAGRTRFHRRIGEELADLEERANPQGSWRAYPFPVFCREDRPLSIEEWDESVALHHDLKEFHGEP